MLCCHLRVKNVIYAEGVRGYAPSTLARRPCSKADFTGSPGNNGTLTVYEFASLTLVTVRDA